MGEVLHCKPEKTYNKESREESILVNTNRHLNCFIRNIPGGEGRGKGGCSQGHFACVLTRIAVITEQDRCRDDK